MQKALFQIHLAVFLWGFTGILGRAISLSAFVLVWYRMLLSAIIIAAIISIRKEWIKMPKNDMLKVAGIGAMFAVHWVSFYASVKLANASIAMICLATAGVFTSILDPLYNKTKLRIEEIVISIVALFGVFLIYYLQPSGSNATSGMPNFELGVLLGVVAAIISALFTILNKPLAQRYKARPLVFYEMLFGFMVLSVILPFYINSNPEQALLPVGLDYLWLFLLSYCCTVWGQNLAMSALKKLSAFTITLSVNLEPVYGIVLAFVIMQENKQLGSGTYWGMALILLSLAMQVALVFYRNKMKKAMNG